jgi:glycosyltransferase involved in cell wall biosynthesis
LTEIIDIMNIWQLDPVNLTPYYDLAVCEALAQTGSQVRLVTSEYLYDDLEYPNAFTVDKRYFRGLNHKILLKYPRLRQLLRGITYPFTHWTVLQEIKTSRPEMIHIQWSRLPDFDLWLIRQIQKLKIPVVHTVHDIVPLFDQQSARKIGQVYALVDALIVHTEANRRELMERFPNLNRERVYVVPHVHLIEHQHYTPQHVTKADAKKRLGIALDTAVVTFFGLIKAYKGLDILEAALCEIKTDLMVIVAGKPDSEHEQSILDRLKKSKNVKVYDFYIPREEVWIYHLAADVVVFPYRAIYQSGALLTAMGFGCPVIVTDVGGMPETVDGNGWVIPPEDPEILAETINEAISDFIRLESMSRRSLEIIEQKHSLRAIGSQLMELYHNLSRKQL